MSYHAQIAFEIRAWEGAPDDVFEQLLGIWLPQYADEQDLDQESREELVELFEYADLTQDGEMPVLRFFDAMYRCSGGTHDLLDHLVGLTEYADIEGEYVEIAGEGFSGTYGLANEDQEILESVWGPNQDDLWGAVEWGATVRPGWTNYGVHVGGHEVRYLFEGFVETEDVCRICDAAMPAIRGLLEKTAQEMGFVPKSAVIV